MDDYCTVEKVPFGDRLISDCWKCGEDSTKECDRCGKDFCDEHFEYHECLIEPFEKVE